MKKRVRMLLRVSTDKQLDASGDLNIQRTIVREFAQSHDDWMLDEKEYFEGGVSGYRNSVADRDVLQEAYADARDGQYDVLAVYKDDRIGRRMWETGAYIMALKQYGVDIYTVKDGCISPECGDVMGQIMLALRYGNAQKSSSDTGMRVRDTAVKLTEQGKFMGGRAPFGYCLEYSGEISRHGRALKHLVIVPDQKAVVEYIFDLSLNRDYGSQKIAGILNQNKQYRHLAPGGIWKSGTITGILTNPVYMGHIAYGRRERKGGRLHRTGRENWVLSGETDERIRIIDRETWEKVQQKRMRRMPSRQTGTEKSGYRSSVMLQGIVRCGICGRPVKGSIRYNYWTLKNTGERRKSRTIVYQCPEGCCTYRGNLLESAVFQFLVQCAESIMGSDERREIAEQFRYRKQQEEKRKYDRIRQELEQFRKGTDMLEMHIPDATAGQFPFSLDELICQIRKRRKRESRIEQTMEQYETVSAQYLEVTGDAQAEGWDILLKSADATAVRMLALCLIRKIEIFQGEIRVFLKTVLEK